MEIWYFLVIIITIVALYGLCSFYGNKPEYVICVEAGPSDNVSYEDLKSCSFYDHKVVIRDKDGTNINTSDMFRVVVRGNCMKPKSIEDGAQLLVKKINPLSEFSSQIKQGDILLIHLNDSRIDKIRIFDEYNNNGELLTYRYDNNSVRINSSKPHKKSSIIGVVKYKIQ